MNRIGTVIFDLGGVLIDYSMEAAVRAFRRLGFMHFDEMADPYTGSGVFLAMCKGEVPPQAFYDEVSCSAGRPVEPGAVDAALCSFLIDLPGYKLDMLLELRRRGYRLFMLSNTNAIMMEYIANVFFRKQGLTVDDYFDRLFLSHEMGMAKPDPEIFEEMIRRTGLDPAESLFIDDSKANVDTARSLGFRTYLASEHEDFRPLFDGYEPKG